MTTTPIDQMVDEAAAHAVEQQADRVAANDIAAQRAGREHIASADRLPGKPHVDRNAAQFINARIDGADLKLQIVPDDLRVYAAAIEPPFSAMSKLVGDTWTPDLIEKTLHFAALPVDDRERMAKFSRYGINTQFGNMQKNPTITRALATRPMAQYARLAALCLMAALLGIPDEEATFSDESDGTP
ncbi:hypothetical protein [Pelagibacterium lacus]|uniref:Tail assembly chaperone n=1 Tax=Pelagibacterium lacus TaxID=2282655 RepID=A0A369W8H1_9HYPH|nr:hypothetical protein [Pelagibacterium lacus]RDE10347.1 hypothetical protein DVH29_02880 [Pelagibacterium lacus]